MKKALFQGVTDYLTVLKKHIQYDRSNKIFKIFLQHCTVA